MFERKKSIHEQVDEETEALFRKKVQETMNLDPTSGARPLRFRPGTEVWVIDDDNEQMRVKIKKGSAGVYVAIFTTNDGTEVPLVINEQAILTDVN